MIHVQARATSAAKQALDFSYRVAKRRNCLSLLKRRSMRLRSLCSTVSQSRFWLRLERGGTTALKIQGVLPPVTGTRVHRESIPFESGHQFRPMCGPSSHRDEMCRILSLTPMQSSRVDYYSKVCMATGISCRAAGVGSEEALGAAAFIGTEGSDRGECRDFRKCARNGFYARHRR